MTDRIAVIGAGIAGLAAARHLSDRGVEVTVFDKGRGPGGRTARRRTGDGMTFDHGAQYFSVRDPMFQERVEQWQADGLVQPWGPRLQIVDDSGRYPHPSADSPIRYVGIPGMNQVARSLAAGLDCRSATQIERVLRDEHHGRWQLSTARGEQIEQFTHVLVTAPPPQAALLLEGQSPLAEAIAAVRMLPTWAVMLAYDQPLEVDFDAAFVTAGSLSWIARNSSKPGRPPRPDTWVLHATHEWSQQHVSLTPKQAMEALLADFASCCSLMSAMSPVHRSAHLWRYAAPDQPLPERCLVDFDRGLAVAGDWCGDKRVEGAFLSGIAAAERLLETLPSSPSMHPTG